jgi:hypothetical protein
MALQKMSVKQYIEYRAERGSRISAQAVSKAILNGYRTPGIVYYEKYGGTYVLHVDTKELDSYLVVLNKPVKLHSK